MVVSEVVGVVAVVMSRVVDVVWMLVVMSRAVGVVGVVSWVVDWGGGGGGGRSGFGRGGVWVGGGGFEWSLRSGWERLW